MAFGRYFLGEKFTRKDIIVALLLFGLMAVGFYWK
jgi:drug/metabolite transporter (DMT)-like permease